MNHELRCQNCSALFPTKSTADNHQCEGAKRNITCQVDGCQYATNKMSGMRSHLQSHAEVQNMKRLKCAQPSCKFTCTRSSELKRHWRHNHCNDTLKLRCTDCTYVTFSRQHLARHRKTVHGYGGENLSASPTSFHCKLCNYSCQSLDNLRKHILKTKTHQNAFVYNCHRCNYNSNSALDFRGHIERSHLEESDAASFVKHYFAKS